MVIGVFSSGSFQQLRRKPEYALSLMSGHQLYHEGLEVREYLDLRQRFFFYWIHSRPQTV
jgi:hypothetical protein